MDKFKDYPKLDQFKTEALEMNKMLSQQLNEFYLKLEQAEPLCKITSSLIYEAVTLRQEIDDADDKISQFLSWQDTEQGRKANLPRIEEKHKEILFVGLSSMRVLITKRVLKSLAILDLFLNGCDAFP